MKKTIDEPYPNLELSLAGGLIVTVVLLAGYAQEPEGVIPTSTPKVIPDQPIQENLTSGKDLQKIAEQVLFFNNITNYSIENIKKTKLQLDALSTYILAKSVPNLSNHLNNTVWEVEFRGEIEEREYFVIINPINEEIICAFGTDSRAAPGIRPLKIK